MSAFWIVVPLLCVCAGICVLWPLRRSAAQLGRAADDPRHLQNLAAYRARMAELDDALTNQRLEESEYQLSRLEVERALLVDTVDESARPAAAAAASRRLPLAIAVMVPLLAWLLYQQLGAADKLRLDAMLKQSQSATTPEQRAANLLQMLPLLQGASEGSDPNGDYRYLLARTYMSLDRYADAAAAFQELIVLYPEDAAVIAQAAQALYLASGSKLTVAVQQLVDRALLIDPLQPTLLGMLGMDRFQNGDYRAAIDNWQKLLANLPPDAPDAAVMREGITMAKARLGGAVTPAVPAPAPAAGGPRLRIAVSLEPSLQVEPEDTVFVFARAVNGPPMPLAVARFRAAELPRQVELNDAMAMAPGLKLSSFAQVEVLARVSRSGNAQAQPGDLESEALRVSPGQDVQDLSISINRQTGAASNANP